MSKLRLLSTLVGIIVGAGMVSGTAAEEKFSMGQCMIECKKTDNDIKNRKDCKKECLCKMLCSKDKEREASCLKGCI